MLMSTRSVSISSESLSTSSPGLPSPTFQLPLPPSPPPSPPLAPSSPPPSLRPPPHSHDSVASVCTSLEQLRHQRVEYKKQCGELSVIDKEEFERRRDLVKDVFEKAANTANVRALLDSCSEEDDDDEGAEKSSTGRAGATMFWPRKVFLAKRGYLNKYKNKAFSLKYRRRYFVLSDGKLFWFRRKLQDAGSALPLGVIDLCNEGVSIVRVRPDTLALLLNDKPLYNLHCISEPNADEWMAALQKEKNRIVPGSTEDAVSGEDEEELSSQAVFSLLTAGDMFRKFRRGRAKLRRVWFSNSLDTVFWSKGKSSKVLGQFRVSDFAEVVRGCESSASASPDTSFSIVTDGNTLELEARDIHTRRIWSKAINQLMRH